MTEESPGVPVTFALGVKPVWAIVIPVVRLATGATRAATMKITRTATITVPKMVALAILPRDEGIEGTRLELWLRRACCLPIVHIVPSNKVEDVYQSRYLGL